LENLAAAASDASPSSSSTMVASFWSSPRTYSTLAFNLFSMSASASFHCSFNHS
jgi:hypothetical protein